jgi:hypothetical protein
MTELASLAKKEPTVQRALDTTRALKKAVLDHRENLYSYGHTKKEKLIDQLKENGSEQ